jgi:hypothetical protein
MSSSKKARPMSSASPMSRVLPPPQRRRKNVVVEDGGAIVQVNTPLGVVYVKADTISSGPGDARRRVEVRVSKDSGNFLASESATTLAILDYDPTTQSAPVKACVLTRETFLGFECAGFYARVKSRNDNRVRVRTYKDPQSAVTFMAQSVGRSPNLTARTTDGDVPILDGKGALLPGAADALRCLLNDDEAALLDLFGVGKPPSK